MRLTGSASMRTMLVLVVSMLGASMPVDAQVVRCDIASKYQCDARSGCRPLAPTIWNVVDPKQRSITRCDGKGCDTIPAQFSISGTFINIAVPDRGLLAKLSSDGSSFSEVATLAGAVLVSFGSCRPQ